MRNLFRNIFIGLLGYLVIGILFTPPAYAQAWRDSSFADEYDSADQGEVNMGAYRDRGLKADLTSLSCMGFPVLGICTQDEARFQVLLQRSVVGSLNTYIASMYVNPPANLALWIQDTGQSLGFIPKPAYAQGQGLGFSGLTAILPIWKVFRNIAYLFLAVVMIVIGFMVMLRRKIDPKTVVTVQNALPRIIITLLLITFSYAIVGVVIDLMYVVILIMVQLFKSTTLLPDPKSGVQLLWGYTTPESLYARGGLLPNFANIDINIWHLFGLNIDGWQETLANVAAPTLGTLLVVAGVLVAGPWGALPGAVMALGVPLLYAIIALALVFLFIRLFIFFTITYIQIILSLLFGPIQILFNAVPGMNTFSAWLSNLIANIAVFPVASVIFMLSAVFAKFANEGGNIWNPPYSPLFSSATAISAVVSLGLLFAIPSIAGRIREALKSKPFVSAGPEGLVGSLGQPVGMGFQAYQFYLSHKSVQQMRNLIPALRNQGGDGGGGRDKPA